MEDKQFHLRQAAPPVSASQTPSSGGDVDAVAPKSFPETTVPLSVRTEGDNMAHTHTAVHHGHPEPLLQPTHLGHIEAGMQTIQPSALTVGVADESQPGSLRLGPSEFAVILPMDSRVKDDYERVLTNSAAAVQDFLALGSQNSQASNLQRKEMQSKMYEVIAQLNNVSIHPDLNISHHLVETESDLDRQTSWAEYSSTKFLLLGNLIDIASTHELHVILAVQDDKKQSIVERYLRGKGFTYTRPREELGGNLEVSLVKGPLSFGVHSNESVRDLFKAPSAILALDTAFHHQSPSVEHIRTTFTRNNDLLPVIWFIVANTCEHIERCLPDLPETDRLRLLLQYTARLHDEVGDLQDNALGVPEHAEEILNYLLHNFAQWQVPSVEPLHFVSSDELESSTSSSDESQGVAQKRSLSEDGQDDLAFKRTKVDTPELAQLTQSTKGPSESLNLELESLEKSIVQMKNTHASEKEQLQNDLNQMHMRFQEMERELGTLQHRYETRTSDLYKTRVERDEAAASRKLLEQRVEKFRDDVTKLKEERTQLNIELGAARQELKDGGGTLADLETAREEIRRLTQEVSGLERKAEYERNQSDYTREQYQNASNAAAQAGNELRQLQSENVALKRKVEGNAAQLREVTNKSDSTIHLDRIAELELTLASRDEFLRKKEEELRDIRKNRPSTRSTSTQPRSPKWAASSRPTSPGVNNGNGNGNGNNGMMGRGSGLRFSSEASI
ncbi:Histone deacetylase complex subunit 2/3 [Penicillium malachiteum]|uniref:Histone deacetylase complex subunit 2/3 n=1 Tax=Penicillium malachiteum TaxID=1324776 RepID=UPI0025492A30|nr:Histone deacetylase complex subunit 2/3 [Penicillium malachiteum]KAJ5735807.1 Histone deacetylase complex subunit 2/3 [Penicillium malachiteum]